MTEISARTVQFLGGVSAGADNSQVDRSMNQERPAQNKSVVNQGGIPECCG